jgi:hypothetical protein
MENMVTTKECTEQINRMARRTALLYYYFASTLIEELGEEQGKRLINKAIWSYGEHCGRAIHEKVNELGLPLTQENFDKIPDLPEYGWETAEVTSSDGTVHPTATFCPLAAVWMELGPAAQNLGRLYCFVDQAKQHAYNPNEDFIHYKNILDNDPYCEFGVEPHQEER